MLTVRRYAFHATGRGSVFHTTGQAVVPVDGESVKIGIDGNGGVKYPDGSGYPADFLLHF